MRMPTLAQVDYSPLGARARGLGVHLCSRDELERWAGLPDLAALGHALETKGRLAVPLPSPIDAADIEQALRRTAARDVALLAPWAGKDNPVLDTFYAEQDRRSLRALLRGAAEGAPAEARLAGLLPTPRLTVSVLAELALARSAREIAVRLLVLGDPHAESLVALTAMARIDLLEVELALARLLAVRLREAARRGDATLREYVSSRIDLVNAVAALQLAESESDTPALPLFVAGGAALDRDAFVAAATASTRADAAARLARGFAATPLAALFARQIADPTQLEAAALVHTIAALRRRCRIDPLGSAPVLLFLVRLEAQNRDLRRLAWGLALKVPPDVMRAGLATPWS